MFDDLQVLTVREVRRWIRAPILSLTLIATPAAWILIFGYALNSAVFTQSSTLPNFHGAPNYFNYIATGMIVAVPIASSVRTGSSLFSDRFTGYLSRLLVSPASRWTILYSKTLGNAIISFLQVVAMIFITIPFGLDVTRLGALGAFLCVGSTILLAWGFASIFMLIAMRVRRPATQQLIVPLITTPLTFLSNVFYPAAKLPQILKDVVRLNPLSYAADLSRGVFFQGDSFPLVNMVTDILVLLFFVFVSTAALYYFSKRWL